MMDAMEAAAGPAHKVKLVRSDQGGEFINKELAEQLAARGVLQESTSAYSPESNGRAERANRTIMEKARAMMAAAQLPPKFWAAAAVHANFLRNVSPVAGSTCTPWEQLRGSQPNVGALRTFGALVYVHVPDQKRRKLDPKSETGVLIGQNIMAKTVTVYLNGGVK